MTQLNGKRICREIRPCCGEKIESVAFGPLVPARAMQKNVVVLMGRGEILNLVSKRKDHIGLTEVQRLPEVGRLSIVPINFASLGIQEFMSGTNLIEFRCLFGKK